MQERIHPATACLAAGSSIRRQGTRVFAVALLLFSTALLAADDHGPSPAAQKIPGAKGRIVYTPTDHKPGQTTYWLDTDGVDPGKPGCHIGVKGPKDPTPNDRFFGEACDRKTGYLIESNPGVNAIHAHENDIGHPDTFDCQAWCAGTSGKKTGMCVPTRGPAPCDSPTGSAMCVCK